MLNINITFDCTEFVIFNNENLWNINDGSEGEQLNR